MKTICIIGSPRSKGSTSFIVDKIIEGMKAHKIEVVRYVLAEQNINFCKGCRRCEVSGECVQHDDMHKIMNDLLDSDIVLLASPSYWSDVTAHMKVFIDRSLPFCDTNSGVSSVPSGKVGLSVALRAGSSKKETQHIIDTFEHYFGHLGIKPIGRLTIENIREVEDIQKNTQKIKEAYNLGFNAIINH
ncbi:MAG: flavodoxin family protein [Candidatus Hodarchaeota archaeon]